MFCPNCGKQTPDDAEVCAHCGRSLRKTTTQSTRVVDNESKSNGFAIAGFILSFFMPTLGLIFGCLGLSKSKKTDDSGRGLSIAAIVISIIDFVIALILVIYYYSLIISLLSMY